MTILKKPQVPRANILSFFFSHSLSHSVSFLLSLSFCHGIWVGEDNTDTRMLYFPNILKFLQFILCPNTHVNVQNVDLPLQILAAFLMVKRAACSAVLSEEWTWCYSPKESQVELSVMCSDSVIATFSDVVKYLQMLNGVFLFYVHIIQQCSFLLQLCTVNAAFFSKLLNFS